MSKEEQKRYHFRHTDAMEFLAWANVMYPQVFKEWVAIKDVERSVEDPEEEVWEVEEADRDE